MISIKKKSEKCFSLFLLIENGNGEKEVFVKIIAVVFHFMILLQENLFWLVGVKLIDRAFNV